MDASGASWCDFDLAAAAGRGDLGAGVRAGREKATQAEVLVSATVSGSCRWSDSSGGSCYNIRDVVVFVVGRSSSVGSESCL